MPASLSQAMPVVLSPQALPSRDTQADVQGACHFGETRNFNELETLRRWPLRQIQVHWADFTGQKLPCARQAERFH